MCVEAGGWFCHPGPRGTYRKPGSCSLKWAEWCLMSPGLSVGDVGGGVGWFLLLLTLQDRSDVASPEFSVGDLTEKAIRILFFAIGLELGTSCSFRLSLGLLVRDVDRAAGVGGRRASGLYTGVARGRERGSSPIVLSLVLYPGLSVGDVREAVGRDVVLTLSLVAGRVRGSVRGVASTGHSLRMSPELSIGHVGKAAVGARLAPEVSVKGVERCALQDNVPSTQLTSRFYVRATYSGAGQLFSPVLKRVRVKVGEFFRNSAVDAQVSFEGDASLFTE